MDNKFMSKVFLIGLVVLLLVVLITQYKSSQKKNGPQSPTEGMRAYERYAEPDQQGSAANRISALLKPNSSADEQKQALLQSIQQQQVQQTNSQQNTVMPSEPLDNEDYKAVDFETEQKQPSDCFPKDRLTAEDLLPKDAANSKWAQVNPAGQGDVKDQNFLTAGYLMGINTTGQSLRNANYQLRSEPPNKKMVVGPWNQSTMEYDQNRRYFEIGEC